MGPGTRVDHRRGSLTLLIVYKQYSHLPVQKRTAKNTPSYKKEGFLQVKVRKMSFFQIPVKESGLFALSEDATGKMLVVALEKKRDR